MPISFDRRNQRWRFNFNRVIAGKRHRASRLLPKTWTRAEAQKYDQAECARLYAIATGVQRQKWLIDDAVLYYLEERAPTLKSFANIQRELAAFADIYAGKTFEELPSIALKYARDNATTLAPATVRNRLAYLCSAVRYGWKHHDMGELDRDPAARVVLPAVNNARHYYFDRRQFIEICRQIPPGPVRMGVRVAFYSGMRAAEVQRAKLVADGMLFDLGTTKNGEPRLVPVHPRIAHITRSHWPVGATKWTISKGFKAGARAAEFPHARLHDMRHSTASAMLNAGADLSTVGAVLGHESMVSTKRYSHLMTERLTEALGLVGTRKRA